MTARSSHAVLPLALVAGTMVLAVAACGGDAGATPATSAQTGSSSAGAPTTTDASTTSAGGPSVTPSSSPTSARGTGCAVAGLKIAYTDDAGGAGAGSVTGTLTFTNTSSAGCTLAGFPGVSYVGGGNGTQVGEPATHTGDAVKTRTLAPGKSVKAALRRSQAGFYGDSCHQTKVDGLRVYPPGSTDSAFVALKTTGCKSTSAPLLQVAPVR
ncbi:MAG TPA: DUF4232 domain-containing protein [Friedmanniella sp.]